MTLAAIDWLSISINLLLVVFVIVCLLMTLLILMQRPKQEGLGAAFGGGVTDQVFGARTTNVLQRGTVYLGSAFFILALLLAILIGHQRKDSGLLESAKAAEAKKQEQAPVAPQGDSTQAPVSPVGQMPKSLLDELPADTTTPDVDGEQPAPSGDEPAPGPQEATDKPETPAAPVEGGTSEDKPEQP